MPPRAWAILLAASAVAHGALLWGARPEAPGEEAALAMDPLTLEAARGLLGRDRAGTGFDHGRFFLRAETEGRPAERERLLSLWEKREASLGALRGPGRFEDAIARVVLSLFRAPGFRSYERDAGRLSGFFDASDPGGNCEARTKLVVASLSAAKIELPEHVRLGLEVYADHVQPVLLDEKEKKVWDLLGGARARAPKAAIYHPALLLHAYLLSRGERPPVSDSELLLVGDPAKGTAVASGLSTDSKLRFPPSPSRFNQGPVPERARLPLPEPGRVDGGGSDPAPIETRASFLASRAPVHLFAMDSVGSPFGISLGTLVFNEKDDAARYASAGSDPERRELLLDLAAASLARDPGEARLRDGAALLADPEGLPFVPASRIAALSRARDRIERLSDLLYFARRELFGEQIPTDLTRLALEDRVPGLREFSEAAAALPRRLGEDPSRLLRLLHRLPRPGRRALLELLVRRLARDDLRALALRLADPRLVLVDREDREDREAVEVLVEVDLEASTPGAGRGLAGEGRTEASSRAVDSAAPEGLARSALADLLLSGLLFDLGSPLVQSVYARWDAGVSASLLEGAEGGDEACALRRALEKNVVGPLLDSTEEQAAVLPGPVVELDARLEGACPEAGR